MSGTWSEPNVCNWRDHAGQAEAATVDEGLPNIRQFSQGAFATRPRISNKCRMAHGKAC